MVVDILKKNDSDVQRLQKAKKEALSKAHVAIDRIKVQGIADDLDILNALYQRLVALNPKQIQIFSVEQEDQNIELNAFTDYKNPSVSLEHLGNYQKLVASLVHENLHPVIHNKYPGINEDDEEARVIAMTMKVVGKEIDVQFQKNQNGQYSTYVHSLDPNLSNEEMNTAIHQKAVEELRTTKDPEYIKFLQQMLGPKMLKKDRAMFGTTKGGIDLTPANMNLLTQNNGGEIKSFLDPAMLQQLRNNLGFMPVIINIQPMTSLRMFLGLGKNNPSTVS